MAGERTWIGEFREVSAVCTHPDAQGRGYARALIGRVVNRIIGASETPFLHVESANARDRALRGARLRAAHTLSAAAREADR
jgi:predicted GNAT family acetyltransferase